MARIRSIHPGLFTDEAFASLSSDAQVFLIGLWTEADDQGVFEWKPLTLRMRLRPLKDGPVEPLLDEIASANCVKHYEIDGRQYGAIRNFRKYQKPKSPNAVHPLPNSFRSYVGLEASPSEQPKAEVIQFPQNGETVPQSGEKSPLMEDGGGKREDGEGGEEGGRGDAASKKAPEYAFEGRVIRLTAADFDRWVSAYPKITDMCAELRLADDYYHENPPKDGKWFFPVSQWLKRANEKAPASNDALAETLANYRKWGVEV